LIADYGSELDPYQSTLYFIISTDGKSVTKHASESAEEYENIRNRFKATITALYQLEKKK